MTIEVKSEIAFKPLTIKLTEWLDMAHIDSILAKVSYEIERYPTTPFSSKERQFAKELLTKIREAS